MESIDFGATLKRNKEGVDISSWNKDNYCKELKRVEEGGGGD